MGTFGSFEVLIGSFFGSTAACQHHGRALLEMKRSRICHHIAARSGSNAAELNQKPGLKSWPISVIAAIQMRQRMRASFHFFIEKDPKNAPFILNFPPLFETTEHQDREELRS